MGDEKQSTSGKPNKFDRQNKQTEERKAADDARQGQPIKEPAKEGSAKPDTAAQKK